MVRTYLHHQIKKRFAAAIGRLGDATLFAGIVLAGGIGTSWHMIQNGSSLTTVSSGPWVAWVNAGRADADPYTRAHYSRDGGLPISSEIALTYLARTDSAGAKLLPECEYAVEGADLPGSWWSLTVFDERGKLLRNPLQRYGYTSETVALRADGGFTVTLAREARAGNWVPTGGSRKLALMLTLLEPPTSISGSDAGVEVQPPNVRRLGCG